MIRKTILIIFISALVISCGKKADPEYKALVDIKFNKIT
tara:strand:+ start:270 stop:386 length:117 start_codon:yes stop_codon:yes gene_type:complete